MLLVAEVVEPVEIENDDFPGVGRVMIKTVQLQHDVAKHGAPGRAHVKQLVAIGRVWRVFAIGAHAQVQHADAAANLLDARDILGHFLRRDDIVGLFVHPRVMAARENQLIDAQTAQLGQAAHPVLFVHEALQWLTECTRMLLPRWPVQRETR